MKKIYKLSPFLFFIIGIIGVIYSFVFDNLLSKNYFSLDGLSIIFFSSVVVIISTICSFLSEKFGKTILILKILLFLFVIIEIYMIIYAQINFMIMKNLEKKEKYETEQRLIQENKYNEKYGTGADVNN